MPETSPNKTARTVRADSLLIDAVDFARQAAIDISRPTSVGEHLGARMEAERLAVHRFACLDAGYPGWAWEVSVARAPRAKNVTVCEVDLIPGENTLMAPAWLPWEDRVEPGDLSREDVVSFDANDPRLVAGFEQVEQETKDILGVEEIGMGRPRVLSQVGLDQAAVRWYASERGPVIGAQKQPNCSSCGFLLKMNGTLGQLFGVCANEWSPDDGTVVSLDHSCGAHSETDTVKRKPQWAIPTSRLDDFEIDVQPFGR